MMRKSIEAHAAPGATNFILQLVEQLLPFRQVLAGFGKSRIDGDAASFRIDDKGKDVPGAKGGDLSFEGRLLVEVFQYRDVGVVDFVVAVDAFIVGKAWQDLVIAGIGKPHAVGAVYFVVIFAVADRKSTRLN